MGIVQSTLKWLAQEYSSLLEGSFDDEQSRVSDSSSTLQDTSPGNSPQTSRKRKRDGELQAMAPRTPRDIRYLYTAVCCNLIQLQDIMSDITHGYDIEHLKAALKCPPDNIAMVLDCTAIVVNYLVRYRCSQSKMENDIAWLLPFLSFWQSQSIAGVEGLDIPLHVSQCKPILLNLLTNFQSLPFPKIAFVAYWNWSNYTMNSQSLSSKPSRSWQLSKTCYEHMSCDQRDRLCSTHYGHETFKVRISPEDSSKRF